ncbi:hypothetical protein Enr10x_55620 [Gimesia panareensis]|uniref:Uncharacterized protein n=1 Tax=Gimesia panareensis TaxID=2527978 RepID=A0A517QEY7_9PLAN|nr:hypothetical protein [Gimesia panareensis]QDT30202.1 hypothetical protein Enr10x_55620 [Gimesia panareensis]
MSIEVACPACGGSIQIEEAGEVVACPLCQVHLQIDPETSEALLVSMETDEEPEATPESAESPEAEAATTETGEETKAASPFDFLPGGHQAPKAETRETPKFDFLPGGSSESAENESAENESAEVTEPEVTDEPAEETPTEAAAPPAEEATVEAADADTEEASPFAFLSEGNQPPRTETRETPKFDFLPGGSNETADKEPAEVTEPEATEEQVEETPSETAEATTEEAAAAVEETDTEATPAESEAASPFSFLPGGNAGESTPEETAPPANNFAFLPGGDGADTEESEATEETVAETEAESTTEVETSAAETSESEATEAAATPEETSSEATTPAETTTAETESTEAEAEAAETAESTPATPEPAAPAPQSYRKEKVVPKKLFTLTLTYAIAATIMVAMLLYAKYQGDPHQLESLPDLKPPIKNDEIALQLVPENAELPPGHTLQLGGPGRRFGNVMVTPLRVTRGPLEFEHYTGDASKTREHTAGDVLKLYLKFENMSDDQTFEPLDQKLLLSRVPGKTPDSLRANNFVCRLDQQKPDGERVLVYDMPPSWEWNLKGQNINRETTPQKLAPGESFETYIATNEQGIDSLTGELVWRVQIRKGYNPKSQRGVTTLIDVVFNSDQIQKEVPTESKAALPTS